MAAKKEDLVNEVQLLLKDDGLDINKKETGLVVDAVVDSIIGLTGEAGELKLIGFGTFEVRERAARKGRNPRTGVEIEIPASKSPAFKPGKVFKEFVK